MRRRFQKPRIKSKHGYWISQYRDLEGKKRKVSLGPVARIKKAEAETKLASILEPLNNRLSEPTSNLAFGAFVERIYLPFYRRKWKASTTACNEDRIKRHLVADFAKEPLKQFSRDQLQRFLDTTTTAGYSYSIVAHLRWDLRQIFRMAASEGYLSRNPAELLFIPREAPRPAIPQMTLEQVSVMCSILALREKVVAGLAVLAGMRPGRFSPCAAATSKTDTRISGGASIGVTSTHRRP